MGQADKLYQFENADVGYREGYSGGHYNNIQKFSPAVPGLEWSQGQAWCMTFQSYKFRQADLASLGPVTASTATGYQWYKNKGRVSPYPAAGALIFFGPGAGSHVGFVYGYDETYIYTVEGNTNDSGSAEGNGVYKKKRVRRDSYLYGYGYPDYAEGIVTADPDHKVKGSRYAKTASLSLSASSAPSNTATGAPFISFRQVAWAAKAVIADERRVAPGPDNPQDDVEHVADALTAKGLLVKGEKSSGYKHQKGFFDAPMNAAYKLWQASLYGNGPDSDGFPGVDSLTKLGNATKKFQVRDTTGAYKPVFLASGETTPPVVTPPATTPPVTTPPATVDYTVFPGASKFGTGQNNGYVTQLGKWLVARGGSRFYSEGPGPEWGTADQNATMAFQAAQGWSGSDADGIPGQDTWNLLKTNAGKSIPASGRSPISPYSVTFNRYTGGGSTTDWIKGACAAAGVPYNDNWRVGLTTAMNRESSGNPNACNINDLNAITPAGFSQVHDYGDGYYPNGTIRAINGALTPFQCSRGAWQTIPQTFAQYHAAGTSNNIYDPVAVGAAAILYVIAVYGVAKDGSNLASRVQQFDPSRSPKGY